MDPYPQSPGYKETAGASQDAAEQVRPKAETVRARVLDMLQAGAEVTADEAAFRLRLDVLTVRPRFTELFKQGLIEKTDERRRSSRGVGQVVWRACAQIQTP